MVDFLEDLAAQRRKFLDGLDANQGDINLDIFEDFYPDQAHFVFELLQNAEDAGATEARFILSKLGCRFEHNGSRMFNDENVRAITGIHNSTKTKDPDQIGKFGLGFKSVFVYTASPEIKSGQFSFRILRQVMPVPIERDPDLGEWTRFWLPFNHPEMTPMSAFEQVQKGLSDLSETTLLFLSNIESISWNIEGGSLGDILRVSHSEYHTEVLKQIHGQSDTNSHFFMMKRAVMGLESQHVAVAYPLVSISGNGIFNPNRAISEQFKIVPAKPGRVAVYFPAEKETSGLRFHLHAPFVPELSRASVKDTATNDPLFDQLESLVADSLFPVRDLGLLTVEFLGVLPNPADSIPQRYTGIRDIVLERMRSEALTPTHAGNHAPAKYLLQARASLKNFLPDSDLEILVAIDGQKPSWAVGATQKNSDVDRLISALDITDWDASDFARLISKLAGVGATSVQAQNFSNWISHKTLDWHQNLYALLYTEYLVNFQGGGRVARSRDGSSLLDYFRDVRIVRLFDGQYSCGNEAFFPEENTADNGLMCRVHPAILTAGKNDKQKESAKQFLLEIGVRTVGEEEIIESILKNRYTYDATAPNKKVYLADLRRFIRLLEEKPDSSSIFTEFYIFMGSDEKWRTPDQVYLDTPFKDTGLEAYYGTLDGIAQKKPLSTDFYNPLGISLEKIGKFACSVSASSDLHISRTSCGSNPDAMNLVWRAPGNRTIYGHDEDYTIENIKSIIGIRSIPLSKLVWNTLVRSVISYSSDWTKASYSANASKSLRHAPSQLVVILSETEWIPQRDGRFVKPADASVGMLPEGFKFDSGFKWLAAIGFAENEAKDQLRRAQASEEHKQKLIEANKLGFTDEESLDDAQRFAQLPAEKRKRILDSLVEAPETTLPENDSANPERRAEHIREEAEDAPGRESEQRVRAVSKWRNRVTKEARPFLENQYTNPDHELICQICEKPMPFKVRDGSYYFVAVECVLGAKKFHRPNYIALCPNHEAMFKNANDDLAYLKERILAANGTRIHITLAGKASSIYFTKTHLIDLRAAMVVENYELTDEPTECDDNEEE